MALDDPLHPLEVTGEKGTEPLRVERLAERSRAREVAEEDGDGLPLLARHRGGDRRPARLAEACRWPQLMAARGAERHPERVSRLSAGHEAGLPP